MAAKGPDQARAEYNKPKSTKIKVKQDMIDSIKGQGMTRALKRAGEIKAAGGKGEAEFLEGVRRMYGERRLAEATKAAAGSYSSKSKNQPEPKTAAYAQGKKGMVSTKKPVAKKSDPSTVLKVAGGLAAAGALIASRGKAASLAARLSPGLAKSGVGKALGMGAAKSASNVGVNFGKKVAAAKEAAAAKALTASGKVAAKTTKSVSQSQYDAMLEAAKAKGISATKAAAAKATKATPKVKAAPVKAPVKASTKKLVATAGIGIGGKKK
jgi:hypothetical protein